MFSSIFDRYLRTFDDPDRHRDDQDAENSMGHKDNYNTYAYVNSTTDHTYASCYPIGPPENGVNTGGPHSVPSSGNSHEMTTMFQETNKQNDMVRTNRKSNDYHLTPHNYEDTVPRRDVKGAEGQTSSDGVDAKSADSDGDPNTSYAVLNKTTSEQPMTRTLWPEESDYQDLKTNYNDDTRDKETSAAESPYHVLNGPTPPSPPNSPVPTIRRNNPESEDVPYDVLNEPSFSLELREVADSSHTDNPTEKDAIDQIESEQSTEESPYHVLEGPTPTSPPDSPMPMLQRNNDPESGDVPYDVLNEPLLSVKLREVADSAPTESPTDKDAIDQIESEQSAEESPYHVLDGPTPPSPPNSPIPSLQRNIEPTIVDSYPNDEAYDLVDSNAMLITAEAKSDQSRMDIEPYADTSVGLQGEKPSVLIGDDTNSEVSNSTDYADPGYETVDKFRKDDLPKSTVASNINTSYDDGYDRPRIPAVRANDAKVDGVDNEASDDTYL